MSVFPPLSLRSVLEEVATLLKNNHQTISIVETAAGGIISAALLSVPGASTFYRGGLTLYTLDSRIAFAGWTEDDAKAYRGPTSHVVAEMATHVRGQLSSTFTLCESGIAGPSGNTALWTRTPGYAALAVASQEGVVTREVFTGSDEREANMVAFAEAGLGFVRDVLRGEVGFPLGTV